jgi:hypothetical protein
MLLPEVEIKVIPSPSTAFVPVGTVIVVLYVVPLDVGVMVGVDVRVGVIVGVEVTV